jgi:replicative DNA helicase
MAARIHDIDRDVHGFSDRDMPDATEAEQEILGSILRNADVLSDPLVAALTPEDFSEEIHRKIFQVCLDQVAQGKKPNPITIKAFLPETLTDGLTVSQYMARLVTGSSGPAAAHGFASAITHASACRTLFNVGGRITHVGVSRTDELSMIDEIEAAKEVLEQTVAKLAGKDFDVGPGASYLAQFQASFARDTIEGVPLCLPEIAKVLSEPCLEAGNLYGLLSSSGEGKTSLTLQMIYEAIVKGHPVLFLSYDQNAAQCTRQMVAQVHGIAVHRQREPRKFLSEKEQEECFKFGQWIDTTPTEIIRCEREGVGQLIAYAKRFVKRRGNGKTPFVVLDHIGKVKPRDPKLSADRISGEVTVELKAMAESLKCAVLVLNQRNSAGTARDNPRPIARDLYGGEGARADYDAVLYLYRPEKYKAEREKVAATDSDWKKISKVFGSEVEGIAEIGAIKVRFGNPNITATVDFDANFTRYKSQRQKHQEGLDF